MKKYKKIYQVSGFLIAMIFCVIAIGYIVHMNQPTKPDGDWYIDYVNFQAIYQYADGDSQTIAIIDTGVSDTYLSDNKDAENKIIHTYNMLDHNNNINDTNGHGTEMFYLIQKLVPKANMIVIQAIGDDGHVDSNYIVKAIEYAIHQQATILNLSFGSHQVYDEVRDMINIALSKGISVLASAGDYQQKDILFPASMDHVIAIEAKQQNGERWHYSNTSDLSSASFPGDNIRVISTNEYHEKSGTSHATAIATAYIALLRDYHIKNEIHFDHALILHHLKMINSIASTTPNYMLPFGAKQDLWSFSRDPVFLLIWCLTDPQH